MIPFTAYLADARVMASVVVGDISGLPSNPDVTDPTILAIQPLPDIARLDPVLQSSMSTWFATLAMNTSPEWIAASNAYRIELSGLLSRELYDVVFTDPNNWKPIRDPVTNQIIGHITTFRLVHRSDPTRRFDTPFQGATVAIHITLSFLKV